MEDYKQVLSERVKALRIEQNIKVSSILTYVGIKRSTWDNYIAGNRIPRGTRLVKLAEILNTTTDYLTGKTVEKFAEPNNKDIQNVKVDEFTINGKPLTDDQYKMLDEVFSLLLKQ